MFPDDADRTARDLQPVPGSFLAGLAPTDRAALFVSGRSRRVARREFLYRQGDPGDHVLYVLTGWTKVVASSERGNEVLLALRGPGDVLGELAALDGRPRAAAVVSLTPLTTVVVSASHFVAGLQDRPTVALGLLRELAGRLRDADRKRLESVAQSTAERLAAFLLDLVDSHGVPGKGGTTVDMPLSQREIGGAVAASRETVAKLLRVLRERDIVRTSRNRIVVVRRDALEGLARSVYIDTDGL